MALEQGAHDRAAQRFEEAHVWEDARRCYERLGDRRKVAELSEKMGDWAGAGQAWETLGELPRAADAFHAAGLWDRAARLYERTGAFSRAAECYERAGDWERVGEMRRQLSDFVAASGAFMRAAREAERADPGNRARLAGLWETAEACCVQTFDDARAIECRKKAALYRQRPYVEIEIASAGRMVEGQYAYLELVLANDGGGEARQVIVHHTPSEFLGELSQSREIRMLPPGETLRERLSVRPLASGPVPLVVAADYTDRAGRSYEIAYRTRIHVSRPGEPERGTAAQPALGIAFADFEVLVGQDGGDGYPVHVVRSPAGEARGTLSASFAGGGWAEVLRRLEEGQVDPGDLQRWGSELYAGLFCGNVGTRLRESLGRTAPGKGLRLRLRVEAGELISLPWELLYDPEKREFLSLTRRTPVVRCPPVPRPAAMRPLAPPLHMLVVAASPRDWPELDVRGEVEALEQAVRPLVDEGALALHVLQRPTVRALRERLVDRPCHVLHFVGHGGFDWQGGYIVLEDEAGLAHELEAARLKVLLSGAAVRMAVLGACLTARDAARADAGAPSRAYLGVAPALVDAGLLAVVAMQFSLSDRGARVFAGDFYRMLARYQPVDEAVDRARVAVMLELGLDCRDWAAPVLFLRGSDGVLLQSTRVE
jgi:tetratricopeptide (TPR) repeat protein